MANDNILNAKKVVDDLTSAWDRHVKSLMENTKVLSSLNKEFGKVPSEYIKSVKSLDEVEKQRLKTAGETERAEKRVDTAIKAKIPTLRQLATVNKQNQKATQDQINLYNKVQQKIKEMLPTYNNLATKQQLGIKLTAKEVAELDLLTKRLTKYRGALNEVNKSYGNYSLEVGNYAKGTKNLQNSLNQISRELPNFGQSFEVGVLSLTNNIGALIDGVKQVKAENVKLRAEGKQTNSVFKTILGSIFNWQTFLFIGIGIFSAYSKEIKKFVSELFTGKKEIIKTSEALDKLGKDTQTSIGRLKGLVGVVRDVTTSEEDRLDAIIKLNREYPEFNTNILNEKSNTELVNKEIDKYIDLLIKRGKAKAIEESLGKKVIETIKLEEKLTKVKGKLDEKTDFNKLDRLVKLSSEYSKLDNADKKRIEMVAELDKGLKYLSSTERDYIDINTNIIRTRGEMNKMTEELSKNYEAEEKIIQGTVNYYEELISQNNKLIKSKKTTRDLKEVRRLQEENKEYQKQIDLILNVQKNTKKRNKTGKETLEITTNSELAFEKQISTLKELQSNTELGSKQWGIYNNLIKLLETSLKALKGELNNVKKSLKDLDAEFPDFQKNMEQAIKTIEALREETNKYIEGFSDDFIRNNPLSNLKMFFDFDEEGKSSFDKLLEYADTGAKEFSVYFNTIAESAQQAFNFIDSLSQANFEAQYSRLEQQKNIAIQFAGESTTAREEVERQYEERRREIQTRQAKAQQDQAVFNAAVNTAQAAISAYATQLIPGDPTSIPRALTAAALTTALGLAQVVAIKSQELPRFWQGGEVGGMQDIIVNDDPFGVKGRNYKEVIEKPNGDILTPQGKNVKMRVPKGSYVHPTYDAFINSLDNELINNNIMPVGQSNIMPMIINDGLKRSDLQDVFSQEISKLNKTIKSKKSVQIINDRRGQAIYEEDERGRRKIMNSRYSGKGIGV